MRSALIGYSHADKMLPTSGRVLNLNGKEAHYRAHVFLATLFSIVMIFYAAFRGQRVVTQLPAVFRTTVAPKKLPVDVLNSMFNNAQVPNHNFDLPVLTVCPATVNASMNIMSCSVQGTILRNPCTITDVLISNGFGTSSFQRCRTIEGGRINTTEDALSLTMNVNNVAPGSPDGVLVSVANARQFDIGNLASAGANMKTILLVEKLYKIDAKYKGVVDYEIRAVPMTFSPEAAQPAVNNSATNTTTGRPIMIEMRYPALEVTYEKTFLPFDMNHWLGEVGGLAALLFLLYKGVMKIVDEILLKHPKTSESGFARLEKEEQFALN